MRPQMPIEEMRRGLAEGRRLCQEEWSSQAEKAAVDQLEKEGICTTTPWEYSGNFQCERRYAIGIKQSI